MLVATALSEPNATENAWAASAQRLDDRPTLA